EGLARAGHAHERLKLFSIRDPFHQRIDRLRLIALGLEGTDDFEAIHEISSDKTEASIICHGRVAGRSGDGKIRYGSSWLMVETPMPRIFSKSCGDLNAGSPGWSRV